MCSGRLVVWPSLCPSPRSAWAAASSSGTDLAQRADCGCVASCAAYGRAGPGRLAAGDLAAVLAALHDPAVLQAVSEASGPLPEPTAPASTDTLRAGLGPLIRPDQRGRVLAWCDWADRALAGPGRAVLVHGDFHGDNHLWDRESLRLRLPAQWVNDLDARFTALGTFR
ncbi:phosphotransferase [Actinoplanes sp. CA-051413]|uniref:phosphotransferase n=1 Tax=Actinoplanes sp. CA-051413 TaxID=3239899 RepID=UPI003D964031